MRSSTDRVNDLRMQQLHGTFFSGNRHKQRVARQATSELHDPSSCSSGRKDIITNQEHTDRLLRLPTCAISAAVEGILAEEAVMWNADEQNINYRE